MIRRREALVGGLAALVAGFACDDPQLYRVATRGASSPKPEEDQVVPYVPPGTTIADITDEQRPESPVSPVPAECREDNCYMVRTLSVPRSINDITDSFTLDGTPYNLHFLIRSETPSTCMPSGPARCYLHNATAVTNAINGIDLRPTDDPAVSTIYTVGGLQSVLLGIGDCATIENNVRIMLLRKDVPSYSNACPEVDAGAIPPGSIEYCVMPPE